MDETFLISERLFQCVERVLPLRRPEELCALFPKLVERSGYRRELFDKRLVILRRAQPRLEVLQVRRRRCFEDRSGVSRARSSAIFTNTMTEMLDLRLEERTLLPLQSNARVAQPLETFSQVFQVLFRRSSGYEDIVVVRLRVVHRAKYLLDNRLENRQCCRQSEREPIHLKKASMCSKHDILSRLLVELDLQIRVGQV